MLSCFFSASEATPSISVLRGSDMLTDQPASSAHLNLSRVSAMNWHYWSLKGHCIHAWRSLSPYCELLYTNRARLSSKSRCFLNLLAYASPRDRHVGKPMEHTQVPSTSPNTLGEELQLSQCGVNQHETRKGNPPPHGRGYITNWVVLGGWVTRQEPTVM